MRSNRSTTTSAPPVFRVCSQYGSLVLLRSTLKLRTSQPPSGSFLTDSTLVFSRMRSHSSKWSQYECRNSMIFSWCGKCGVSLGIGKSDACRYALEAVACVVFQTPPARLGRNSQFPPMSWSFSNMTTSRDSSSAHHLSAYSPSHPPPTTATFSLLFPHALGNSSVAAAAMIAWFYMRQEKKNELQSK